MKKIIILLLIAFLAGGFVFLLKKNNYQLLGINFKLKKSPKAEKVYKVGVVMTGGAYQQALDGLKKGLEEKGYFEGRNIVYLIRDTRGSTDAIRPVTEELLGENPDVVYSISTPVTIQVSQIAGNRFPIVFNIVGDPVGAGFVKSYSMPETNLTGCSNRSAELSGKRLEIFKEAFPNVRKVVTFYNPENKFSQISIENTREAAKILQIELGEVLVKDKDELARALSQIQEGQYDGIYITPDAMVVSNADLVIKRSLELKMLTMGHEQTLAEKGVTLTYGANFFRMGTQCASSVASVLSGQKPQGIPVVTPDKLDVVVNLKSLNVMGQKIVEKILKEADQVIK